MIAILGGLGAAAFWTVTTICSSRASRLIGPFSMLAWVTIIGLAVTVPIAAVSTALDSLAGDPRRSRQSLRDRRARLRRREGSGR